MIPRQKRYFVFAGGLFFLTFVPLKQIFSLI